MVGNTRTITINALWLVLLVLFSLETTTCECTGRIIQAFSHPHLHSAASWPSTSRRIQSIRTRARTYTPTTTSTTHHGTNDVTSKVNPRGRSGSMYMKPKSKGGSSNVNTLLRYKGVSQEEEELTVSKWFEENLPKSFPWNHDKEEGKGRSYLLRSDEEKHTHSHANNYQGGGKNSSSHKAGTAEGKRLRIVERDSKMPGSAVIHYHYDDPTHDIEFLPHTSPMHLDLGDEENTMMYEQVLDNTKKNEAHSIRQEHNKHHRHHHPPPPNRTSNDNTILAARPQFDQMALSIASNIETPEQWIEFCENEGGLEPIHRLIHIVAEEIRQGNAIDIESDYEVLYNLERRENAFQSACTACRVLRDLCSKDENWASAITDDILTLNCDDGIILDLVTLLRHANESEMFHSRKVMRKRRELRAMGIKIKNIKTRRERRESRRRCRLYITQLLLTMAVASDDAVNTFRETKGLIDSVKLFSSYTRQERLRRRWVSYPKELTKRMIKKLRKKEVDTSQSAFLKAASVQPGIIGDIQANSNKLLAALGHNVFVPKSPGQKGLRILSLDGGGSRGVASISVMKSIVESIGVEVCDSFDIIAGTSTGAILAFLVGLRRESNKQAKKRYDELISRIFVKGVLSKPMLVFTTATYSEAPFAKIMSEILGDDSMLDTRADPKTPLVFAVSAKLTSSTNKLCLFRNYNYSGGEKRDGFVVSPDVARKKLGFPMKKSSRQLSESNKPKREASRHQGSFRVLQRAALRATTAAPTVFKPVQLASDLYSDGGLVASNPTAVAIHEARTLFPDVPIDMLVSIGTGEFETSKVKPSFGWDGIISQIVKSATDTTATHWVLEDILGQGKTANGDSAVFKTKYFRFDPKIGTPAAFPIDGTDPIMLEKLSAITDKYMKEPEQEEKLKEITRVLKGRSN